MNGRSGGTKSEEAWEDDETVRWAVQSVVDAHARNRWIDICDDADSTGLV